MVLHFGPLSGLRLTPQEVRRVTSNHVGIPGVFQQLVERGERSPNPVGSIGYVNKKKL